MSQSPLDEFNKKHEDYKAPNEEPVHSIHRIFTFAITVVMRNLRVVAPFILLCLLINLIMEGHLKSLILGLDLKIDDLIYILSSGGSPELVEKINSLATQMTFVNLAAAVIIALIYTNLSAYIASGQAGKVNGVDDFKRIVGFMMLNLITLTGVILIKYLLIGIGFSLLIIPGVMVFLYLLFVNFIYVFERKGVWECMVRSVKLMDGVKVNFITFISYAFFVFVPIWILNGISGGPMYLVGFFLEGDSSEFSIIKIVLALISVVLRELIWLTYAVGTCLLYLKRCKD